MKELVTEISVRPINHIIISGGEIADSGSGLTIPVYEWKEYQGESEIVLSDEEQAQRIISSMVRRGDLTDEQWLDVLGIYPAWTDYANGTLLEGKLLLTYENKLYRVIRAHNKQSDWTPDICHALFVWGTPPGVIPVWRQPQGAHDAWPVGSVVQWPEGGTIWDCVQGDGSGLNVWEPGVFGWEVYEG